MSKRKAKFKVGQVVVWQGMCYYFRSGPLFGRPDNAWISARRSGSKICVSVLHLRPLTCREQGP